MVLQDCGHCSTNAALNDLELEVKIGDIMNVHVVTLVTEDPEFGTYAGKKTVIVRVLYELKSTGTAFHIHLADCMDHMGYKPYLAGPGLWCKPMVRPANGHNSYPYILCYVYVDIILCAHCDPLLS